MTNLDAAWRRLRLELVARSEGATGSYDTDSGAAHQKPGTRQPPTDSGDLAFFDKRWARARSDRTKRHILLCPDCADLRAKAGGAVRCCVIGLLRSYMLRKADPSKRKGTQEWRKAIAEESQSLPAIAVARAWGVRKATVLAAREEFGIISTPKAGAPHGNRNAAKTNGSR